MLGHSLGTHVSVGSGRPLQMARGIDSSMDLITKYYPETEDRICDTWSSRNHCFWQRNMFYKCWVQFSRNGIQHVLSAPYHPATNGLAERAVQTFKENMRKATQGDMETKLSRFLFHYRITPHSTTGVSPDEKLLGRTPRSHLDILKPSVSSQRINCDSQAPRVWHQRSDICEEFCHYRSYLVTCVITESRGDLSFYIEMEDGRILRRHIDHICHRTCTKENENDLLPPTSSDTTASSDHDLVIPCLCIWINMSVVMY